MEKNMNIVNSDNIVISAHARKRAKERLNLNKNAIRNLACKAYNSGFNADNSVGTVHEYLSNYNKSSSRQHPSDMYTCIYGGNLFLFARLDSVSSDADMDSNISVPAPADTSSESDNSADSILLVTVYPSPRYVNKVIFNNINKHYNTMNTKKGCDDYEY